ncbi:MAG: dihydropyrimidinase [Planctomycetes bacterium]|nr:dihydropyrimidinase [Planctomycetota bacterium]
MFDLIIQGGQVVADGRCVCADVGVRGEKIAAIGENLAQAAPHAKAIDARGRYVIPGGVDVHVHLHLPESATRTADDYDSGTRSAACGGVTTVIDFAIPDGDESMAAAIDKWHACAAGRACVDYSLHPSITRWPAHGREIKSLIRKGYPTFKQFMIYARQGWQSDDEASFGALEVLREHGGMLMLHAESSRVLDLLIARHHTAAQMRRHGAWLHALTRPHFIEAEAIERVIRWTRATGGRSFIVHMSTADGADLVRRAQHEGVNVLAETCAQYLVLDESAFKRKDGHLWATCPQVKTPADQQRLWEGVKRGDVCNISTDTCAFTRAQKATWRGDFTKIPMGLPGLETLLPIVYTHGVLAGRLTMAEFVDRCCTNPARVMGLYPRKGTIAVGSDADLAIIHPTKTRKVDWRRMQSNCDWNPYQGWKLAGFPEHAFCRGVQIVRDYKFTGQNGHGRFLPRELAR